MVEDFKSIVTKAIFPPKKKSGFEWDKENFLSRVHKNGWTSGRFLPNFQHVDREKFNENHHKQMTQGRARHVHPILLYTLYLAKSFKF